MPHLFVLIGYLLFLTNAFGKTTSDLWGEEGELWSPSGRLPDFSYAGYRFGEEPLPMPPVTANVKDYGAKGDGITDDTASFRRAIAETKEGAILIPEGRYMLSDIIWIEKPNIVLRGEGPDETILVFTTELEDVKPQMRATTTGRPTSRYSWYAGFLWVNGTINSEPISEVTSEAMMGDQTLALADVPSVKVGERVVIELTDDDEQSLVSHLYSEDPGNTSKIKNPTIIKFVSRVESVDGESVKLERYLPFDVRSEWSPMLKTYEPTVSEVGIEDLTIHFPVKPYEGHFTERGMNGIGMNGASDCWVRNVRIENCDSGIILYSNFCTVDGVVFTSDREPTDGDTGHHGLRSGVDCLFQNFDFQTSFIHDLGLSYRNWGNVFKNGIGTRLSLDHHKGVTFDNLFTDLYVGSGERVWRSGGGSDLGRHCGARGTFWGIHSDQPIPLPPNSFGPDSINIVGIDTEAASIMQPGGKWVETINSDNLYPTDLHAAQLERRLSKKKGSDQHPVGH
ncbi:glycosyl hydrolase family 28-related protein [Rubellicoccus peritrichatus]|uniref:Glycosyl hydrolase family 28-related protein n=1 Tax=Rubellicoccus peritrichatus TaxID=3080537 RepID=A0AAQ3LFG0_9BACT|nr:glycosyl hydrolase family 28-related protein [Puniceicoccus sp. CR14]WOO41029.1 glycosyl hydrolase family 28-related protein [Puniceicoccus sp. CR14]